jgi:hypothetical protein
VLSKIVGARCVVDDDKSGDEGLNEKESRNETQFQCELRRSAAHPEKDEQGRSFWISRRDLLVNPEHALKLENFEANHRNPKLEGQRKKAASTPSPPARRRAAKA